MEYLRPLHTVAHVLFFSHADSSDHEKCHTWYAQTNLLIFFVYSTLQMGWWRWRQWARRMPTCATTTWTSH